MSPLLHFIITASILCSVSAYRSVKEKEKVNPNSVSMKVINYAGRPIELFWVPSKNAQDSELVMQTKKPIRNNSDTTINSYKTHMFRVKFHRGPLVQKDFEKGPKDETIYVTFDGTEIHVRQTTQFHDLVDDMKKAHSLCGKPEKDGYYECLANAVFDKTSTISTQNKEISRSLTEVSQRLRNYTCADENMTTTESERSMPFTVGGKTYNLEVLLETPSANIWYVRNFVTPEECAIFRKHGKPRLARATVAAEDGSSVVSEHRKAQQASYNLHQINGAKDPLNSLYDRVLSTTNRLTGYEMRPEGQEDFTIIQYNVDDEYTPHCDGTCDGTEYVSGGRVASAVMYCEIPKRGGAIVFTKADMYVKPEPGTVVIFSYLGPDGTMDTGMTEHSGCPVLEGEKWITTAWMRKGVSLQRPWTMLDPSGGLLMDEGSESDELDRGMEGMSTWVDSGDEL